MTYEEHLKRAWSLSPKQAREELVQIARDQRFAAVVAFIEAHRLSWSQAVGAQSMASDHGKLAHAAGSLHATDRLIGELRTRLRGRAPGSESAGPGDEEPGAPD